MLDSLIPAVVDAMQNHVRRAERAEADAVARALAYLDAGQEGVDGLGQVAQRLHIEAENFDPSAPTAEAYVEALRRAVSEYLHMDVLTNEIRGVIAGLSEIAAQSKAGGWLRLPDTRRKRQEALAALEGVLGELVDLLGQAEGLTKSLASGTGIGGQTLRQISDVLASGRWREDPSSAVAELRQAAIEFRKSSENAAWRELSPRLDALKEKLKRAFPVP